MSAAKRFDFDHMRPFLNRWLRRGLYIAKCKSLPEFVKFVTGNEISYGHGTLKCEVLNSNPNHYSVAMYSPEIIDLLNESHEVAVEIGVNATFNIIPKIFFPRKTQKKQFLTVMVHYRTKVFGTLRM